MRNLTIYLCRVTNCWVAPNLQTNCCVAPNLQTLAGNKLFEKYFYDIKIQVNDDVIVASVNPPCDACSQNVSLWGWKYPYK